MKKWCVLGGDARACYLGDWIKANGSLLVDEPPCDVLVLPFPRSDVPESMTKQLPMGQCIVCGFVPAALESIAKEHGWRLILPLNDETFNQRNALPSAEGAIWAAMSHFDSTIALSRCVVSGYGRIGKELARMLRALNAHVTVAARREESRREAGENSVSFENVREALKNADILFNTVPARIFNEDVLKALPKDALIFDLSSAPYGVDMEAVERLELRAWREGSLPARYAPKEAAKILYEFVEASL